MKPYLLVLGLLAVNATAAAAQFPERVKTGVRVRVWLPDQHPQDNTPWKRQLVRGNVTEIEGDVLRLTIPGAAGTVAVPSSGIRRLDVSLGRNRFASALERAFGGAVVGAISAALLNDPSGSEWPAFDSDWRAAGDGAMWGAVTGAVIGTLFPTERWRRVRLRRP